MRRESGDELTEKGKASLKIRKSVDVFALREGKSDVEKYPVSFVMAMVESGCLLTNCMSTNKAKATMAEEATYKNPDAVASVATAKCTQTRPFKYIADVVMPNDHLDPNVLAIRCLDDLQMTEGMEPSGQ
jgi:hypothetical protein